MPTADRVARGLVERTRDQAALRHLDFIQCAVGHGKEGRTAVERVQPWQPGPITMRQVPWVDELRRIQGIDGTGLGTFVLDARVPAADALQAIRRIEPDDIGKGTPFEHASIDLPLIAAQREIRSLAAGIGQNPIELTFPGACELQLAGELFEAQALVGAQIRADQRSAYAEQNEDERGGAVQCSAEDLAPAQAAEGGEQEHNLRQR